MSIDVLYDKRKGIAALYCSTTATAFGPAFREACREVDDEKAYKEIWQNYHGIEVPESPDEMAHDFLYYCLKQHGNPLNPLVLDDIERIRFEWREQLVVRLREEIRAMRMREAVEAIEYQCALAGQLGAVGDA